MTEQKKIDALQESQERIRKQAEESLKYMGGRSIRDLVKEANRPRRRREHDRC